ncbi:MAG: orotidine-5'-phosphate decarboxylase [Actinomycetota bacterium]
MKRKNDPFIVALDIAETEALLRMATVLRGEVETVKIGLEAYTVTGPDIIITLREMGFRVFADLKLHDIPNTVGGAVRALVRKGASMITIHCSGGRAMLEAAVRAAGEEAPAAGTARPLLLGVTVLTSLDEAGAAEIGWENGIGHAVSSLARLAVESGLDGVVASPREALRLREDLGQGAVIVTPGIRARDEDAQDQARTASAGGALASGADFLVVGRPVTARQDPVKALRELRREAGIQGA